MMRWIPCSEQLPEPLFDEPICIASKSGKVKPFMGVGYVHMDKTWCVRQYIDTDLIVTHWLWSPSLPPQQLIDPEISIQEYLKSGGTSWPISKLGTILSEP